MNKTCGICGDMLTPDNYGEYAKDGVHTLAHIMCAEIEEWDLA